MFKYKPENQTSMFNFRNDFFESLDPTNRWVKLSQAINWDELASIYRQSMSTNKGAPGIDARIIIGAIIIKHKEKLDDRGTIEAIQENPYMQYFLGLDEYTYKPVFDPSLFVTIRYRLGNELFDMMNQRIIAQALSISQKKAAQKKSDKDDTPKAQEETTQKIKEEKTEQASESTPANKGKLQLDATVADAYIKYPTDVGILNDSREKSEELIDQLCEHLKIVKPRIYRRLARKNYLNMAKKKNKTKSMIRNGVRQQLQYLKRNISYIHKILDNHKVSMRIWGREGYKYFLVIQEVYRQQNQMYKEKTNRIDDRIVSIHQPHIRPIVRGKLKNKVEFGAKINVSLQDGFARINQFNFDSYNEGVYMKAHIEDYYKLNGCYSKLLQTDDIYMTRENRNWLKEKGIEHTGRPLGRKPKEELSKYKKRKLKKDRAERNQIEGKFGQGKHGYNLNRILAKKAKTQESWIAAIIFMMNILKLSKDIFGSISILLYNTISQVVKTIQDKLILTNHRSYQESQIIFC